jgi:hypothetical protein
MFSLCVCLKSRILGHIHLLKMLNFGSFPTTEHTGFWIIFIFYVSYAIQVQLTPLTTRWAPPGRLWYKNSWELLEHFWKMIVCLDIVNIFIFGLMCQLFQFEQGDYDLQSELETYVGTLRVHMLRVSSTIAASTAEVTRYICPPISARDSGHDGVYTWSLTKSETFHYVCRFFHFYSCAGALNVAVRKYLNALNSKEKHNTFVYSFPK